MKRLKNMIIRYLPLASIQIILMLFQFCFSWLIALSVTKEGHLKFFPILFEPTDSLAIGDHAYWDKEMAYCMDWPIGIRNYWLALNWGMQNPAYGFANLAGFNINAPINFTTTRTELPDIDVGEAGATIGSVYRELTNGDGKKYFEYRRVGRWNATLVWYIQLGWSIPAIRANGYRCHLCVYVRPFCKG